MTVSQVGRLYGIVDEIKVRFVHDLDYFSILQSSAFFLPFVLCLFTAQCVTSRFMWSADCSPKVGSMSCVGNCYVPKTKYVLLLYLQKAGIPKHSGRSISLPASTH